MTEKFHLSEMYKRQLGLVYQERIADQRVLITGHGPTLSYITIMLGYLGVGSSQGGIYFPPDARVTEDDVFGQILFEDEDIGKPLAEVAQERLEEKFSLIVPCSQDVDIDNIEFDTLIAIVSKDGEMPPMPYFGFPIIVQLSKTAVYIGFKPAIVKSYDYNILTPSLACIGAAMACQEMLRRDNLIRPSKISDTWIELVYHIEQRGIWKRILSIKEKHRILDNRKLKTYLPYKVKLLIGAELINDITFEPYYKYTDRGAKVVSEDDVLIRVKLPKGLFSRVIDDSFELIEPFPPGLTKPIDGAFFSPIPDTRIEDVEIELKNKRQKIKKIIDADIEIPTKLFSKNIVLFGAGGLGSWVAGILARSGLEGCRISIVDRDEQVEEHNLNRQLLYNRSNIGSPKAKAAESRLKELLTDVNEVAGYHERFESFYVEQAMSLSKESIVKNELFESEDSDMDEMEALKKAEETQKEFYKEIKEMPGINPYLFDLLDEEEEAMVKDFVDADVVVTTFDNLRVRWLANVMAKKLNKLMINGGCQEFIANVDLFYPSGECFVCRYGTEVIYDMEVVSCTERSPVLSIVTTTALY